MGRHNEKPESPSRRVPARPVLSEFATWPVLTLVGAIVLMVGIIVGLAIR